MQQFNPLISILIPAYNCEKYIRECLESVINQTYSNLEIIVINDGSTDNTSKIIDQYASKDKRIVFSSQNNQGVSKTRYSLIKQLTGDYFMFVDADDTIKKETCEILIKYTTENNYDILHFLLSRKEDFSDTNDTNALKTINKLLCTKKYNYIKTMKDIDIFTNIPVCKLFKNYLKDYFHFKGVSAEDFYYAFEPIYYAKKIGSLDTTFYYYRTTENSLSTANYYHLNAPFVFLSWCRRIEFYNNKKMYGISLGCLMHASSLLVQLLKEDRDPPSGEGLYYFYNSRRTSFLHPLLSAKTLLNFHTIKLLLKKRSKEKEVIL